MDQNHEDCIHSIQLETTSRCNLTCGTCLKAEYLDSWLERDMDPHLFSRILSQIKDRRLAIHLQGWGEPLMHPETVSRVRQLKAAGTAVTFTTNGTIMNKSIAGSLMDCGLDGLTFSMAGISPLTQDSLRGSGTSDLVKSAMQTFVAVRNSYQKSLPHVAVSYLLTPGTVKELPVAVSWCRKNGVEAFISVHLTQAGGHRQQKLQYMKSKDESRNDQLLRIRTQQNHVMLSSSSCWHCRF